MDSIWNCAFGVDIDLQNAKDNNKYFDNSVAVFKVNEDITLLNFIGGKTIII